MRTHARTAVCVYIHTAVACVFLFLFQRGNRVGNGLVIWCHHTGRLVMPRYRSVCDALYIPCNKLRGVLSCMVHSGFPSDFEGGVAFSALGEEPTKGWVTPNDP